MTSCFLGMLVAWPVFRGIQNIHNYESAILIATAVLFFSAIIFWYLGNIKESLENIGSKMHSSNSHLGNQSRYLQNIKNALRK